MTSLDKFPKLVRGFCVGFPGSGKTGSLAALANAGYKLRIIDFDRNVDPLLQYVGKEAWSNVEVAQFYNPTELKKFSVKLGQDLVTIEKLVPVGTPSAYTKALRLLTDGWKYTDQRTGELVDLGKIQDWKDDTILILDSLTSQGERIREYAEWFLKRQSKGLRIQDWGLMQKEQSEFLETMKIVGINCHILVIAHLKLIEPKYLEDLTNDDTDSELSAKLKEIMEKSTELVPAKYYPSAIGRQLPQEIGKIFPYIVRYETKKIGVDAKRVISVAPSEDCDVKVPLSEATIKALTDVSAATGLLKIFEAVKKSA